MTSTIWAVVVFAVTYILIASERVDKTVAAVVGATAAVVLQTIPVDVALRHIDLNVIFLLVGMMTIVNILATTGLFEWVAVSIARRARGSGPLIIGLLLGVTAVLSAVLDNVTTVVLIAPITILVCQLLDLPAVPFLILEAVFSNIGGTATLVGDPPNVLIGVLAGLPFGAFIVHLAPVVLLVGVLSLVIVRFQLRRRLKVTEAARVRLLKTEPHRAIVDPVRLRIGLVVFGLVLAGFFLGQFLKVGPGMVALGGGMLMAGLTRVDLRQVLGKIEWGTILFFVGLFILVGSLQENGIFNWLGRQAVLLTRGNLPLTAVAILWVSGLASAVVDNIPLVIAMIPLIQSIIPQFATQMGIAGNPALVTTMVTMPLFWSLALGACLGGNGSLIGASANVVISQLARKNGYPITFWGFARVGFPLMILSLAVSTGYILLRYFT